MSEASTKEFYERHYRLHREGEVVCQTSVHDLAKAHRRVKNVLQAFRISNCRSGAEVLDVGCGLGYYTHALSSTGANVTGLDQSAAGVEIAKTTFRDCHFLCGVWPVDIERLQRFDLIWAVDFSVINTFDINLINQRLVKEALARLKPGGCIVVGWSTNLSGLKIGNWSHWSVDTFKELTEVCGFSSPVVAETRNPWLSRTMLQVGRRLGKSLPVFMFGRKNSEAGDESRLKGRE